MKNNFIEELFNILVKKKGNSTETSYTANLINKPELLAKKIGEENTELIIDFLKKNKDGIIHESADLLYHLLVLWVSSDIKPNEIWNELSKRKIKSGFEEKYSRSDLNAKKL